MTNEANPALARWRELARIPGLGGIALYLVLLSGVIVLGVVSHHYPLLFLAFSPVFLAASVGLLLLMRWAWALALAAVVLLGSYDLWVFSTAHVGPVLVQGLLNLVFFFYLIRTEVRSRLR
jgi:hypothetical protein